MNKIMLVGRLSTNIELKNGKDKKYARFNIAVNRQGKDNGADFISCVAFGKTAETMFEYIRKGHRVGIEGRLQVSQYEKEGQKRTSCDVIVESFEFLQTKNEKSEESTTGDTLEKDKKEKVAKQKADEFLDEEFPF